MKDLLKKSLQDETWQTNEGQPKILESAIDLMEHFQRTLKAVTDISHGQTLYEVFRVFKRYLMQYSDAIAAKLPRYSPSSSSHPSSHSLSPSIMYLCVGLT